MEKELLILIPVFYVSRGTFPFKDDDLNYRHTLTKYHVIWAEVTCIVAGFARALRARSQPST